MTVDPQAQLLDRVISLLPPGLETRTVKMFGGLALMVNEQMLVSAQKDGSLLIRVSKDGHEAVLAKPGASQAVMGKDRKMGPGWITIAADALDGDQLATWIARP